MFGDVAGRKQQADKSKKVVFKNPEKLIIPANIRIAYLPPRTPQLNPIEVIWREIRKRGFENILFNSIQDVVGKFIDVTRWNWIDQIINTVF